MAFFQGRTRLLRMPSSARKSCFKILVSNILDFVFFNQVRANSSATTRLDPIYLAELSDRMTNRSLASK